LGKGAEDKINKPRSLRLPKCIGIPIKEKIFRQGNVAYQTWGHVKRKTPGPRHGPQGGRAQLAGEENLPCLK